MYVGLMPLLASADTIAILIFPLKKNASFYMLRENELVVD